MEFSMRGPVLLSSFVFVFASIHGIFAVAPAASSVENFSVPNPPTPLSPHATVNGGVLTINSRGDALNELKSSCIHYLQGTEQDNETNTACGVFKLDSKALAQSPKSFDLPMSLADQKKSMQSTCKIGLSFPKSKSPGKDTLEKACEMLGCDGHQWPC